MRLMEELFGTIESEVRSEVYQRGGDAILAKYPDIQGCIIPEVVRIVLEATIESWSRPISEDCRNCGPSNLAAEVCLAHRASDCSICDPYNDELWAHPGDLVLPCSCGSDWGRMRSHRDDCSGAG